MSQAIIEMALRRGIQVHWANCPAARRSGPCTCSETPSTPVAASSASRSPTAKRSASSRKKRGEMNQTERRYADEVLKPRVAAGELLGWDYETHRLLLARKTEAKGSRSTWYTPDFTLYHADGHVDCHDVKGFHGTRRAHRSGKHRDGRIKLKIAADKYPYHRFAIVWREDGQWQREDL